jgi:hypothetical protein
VVAVLVAIGLLAFWLSKINVGGNLLRRHENLRMAVSLAHEATMPPDVEAPLRPSMYREPLPIMIDTAPTRRTDCRAG